MEPVSVRLARGGDDGTAKAHLRGDAQDTLDVVLGAHGTRTGRRASRCEDKTHVSLCPRGDAMGNPDD
jgi:hypothetical protein